MPDPGSPHAEPGATALNLALSGSGHVITIQPAINNPDFYGWSCSCGAEGMYFHCDFGRAANDAVEHVPDDHTLVITRPNAGGDR